MNTAHQVHSQANRETSLFPFSASANSKETEDFFFLSLRWLIHTMPLPESEII